METARADAGRVGFHQRAGGRRAAAGRTMLRFHQERMSGAAERERRRAYWRGVMDAVAAALDRRG